MGDKNMGKSIFIANAFDDAANSALNNAIELATELKSNRVSSMHLLCTLLSDYKDIADKFKEDTGIEAEEFIKKFKDEEEAKNIYNDNKPLGINNRTGELEKILSTLFTEHAKTGMKPSLNRIYMTIFEVSNSEVLEFLSNNFNVSKVNVVDDEPLAKLPFLRSVGSDMFLVAKNGNYTPIHGRDKEINELMDILGRYDKGSACLIGEPGVGKTAIVEELARRIQTGNVPYYLKNKHIISIDLSAIISGTAVRGSFEENINRMLYEASGTDNIILFIDEFHTIMTLNGGEHGGIGAANIMKPALVNGNVKIIGATTTKEYSKFIERDSAFERRIQPVTVEEPSTELAIAMVSSNIAKYEDYHNCIINADCIKSAVRLSDRYIHDRKLPDKAFSVLDQTAAKLKRVVNKNTRLMMSIDNIKDTISNISGIDVNELDENSKGKIQNLGDTLRKNVIGQDNAIDTVVRAIKRAKSGIKDPNRPIGTLLFVGPTGVGKTELAKQLTAALTGSANNLIRLDMSEYMEKHTVSKMIGSPPGYVGYGDGGQLTEAVRHNPNSIILFDEIEKAHADVFNIMLQIMDDGVLTDSMGRKVSFKDNLIILTSNAGYGRVGKIRTLGFGAVDTVDTDEDTENRAIKALEDVFKPEFLNRLDKIVVFNELSKDNCNSIVDIELSKIAKRMTDKDITVMFDKSIKDYIVENGYSDKYGARNIKRKAQEVVENQLADYIIDEKIKEKDTVFMKVENGKVNTLINDVETINIVSMDSEFSNNG